jgi:hypothetical protein
MYILPSPLLLLFFYLIPSNSEIAISFAFLTSRVLLFPLSSSSSLPVFRSRTDTVRHRVQHYRASSVWLLQLLHYRWFFLFLFSIHHFRSFRSSSTHRWYLQWFYRSLRKVWGRGVFNYFEFRSMFPKTSRSSFDSHNLQWELGSTFNLLSFLLFIISRLHSDIAPCSCN